MVTNKTLDHIFGALADARVGKISSFDIYFDCAFPEVNEIAGLDFFRVSQ